MFMQTGEYKTLIINNKILFYVASYFVKFSIFMESLFSS